MYTGDTLASGTGVQWFPSGPLGVSLQAGVRYLITVTTHEPAVATYDEQNRYLPWADHLGGLIRGGRVLSGASQSLSSEQPWMHLTVSLDANDHDMDEDGVPDCEDCDDYSSARYPNANEVCDGVDNDCDLSLGTDEDVDEDEDGAPLCADCDDADGERSPDASESCDGIDNDCDGVLPPDEVDADGDGSPACDDCDDSDPATHPGATELCDGVDNNCNGLIWPGETDVDGDGFTECDGDCNDLDDTIYPGAPEICDAADSDCDGDTPADETDEDEDGYAECNGECDDDASSVHPGAAEVCNGVDDDCDTVVPADEGDADSDGALTCDDCDDNDPAVSPYEVEDVCDGVDNDCDSATNDDGDADGDGSTICEGDCADGDPAVGADPGNTPPTADAGPDAAATTSTSCVLDPYGNPSCSGCGAVDFVLDGTGSVDAQGNPINYRWEVTDDGGADATITSAGWPAPTLTVIANPPSTAYGLEVTEVVVTLTASDCSSSTTDEVVLSVTCSSLP